MVATLLLAALAVLPTNALLGDEVKFEVREVAGRAATALPVTLSALFAPGKFRDGEVCCVESSGKDGTPSILPAQVDVLSRHRDGSLQHALVTIVLDIAARGVQELYLVPSPLAALTGLLDVQDAPPVAIELVDEAGVRWSARVVRPALKDAVRVAIGPLAGPLASEVEQVVALRHAERELPRLRVRVRWRELARVAGARVEVVVENCLFADPGGAPPDDVAFTRLVIAADDVVLADLADGVVWDRTRFAVRQHVGAALPQLMVREELGYLERNGWLPPFDADHPVASVRADALCRQWIGSKENGDIDGSRFECGIPLDPGPIMRYMPATGDRNDIGPIPEWAALAFNSRSLRAQELLFAADLNGAGAFPVHVRGDDGTMGVEHPAGKALVGRKGSRKCPQTPDRAHAPLLGYATFLLTGERLAEEEFAAQASYCLQEWPHDGRYRYPGSRDFAWSLRTTMLAAALLPDDHPRKAYFGERVARNLADLRATMEESDSPLHAWGSGNWKSSGRKSWPCATQWSPWQGSWVAAALWWTARLHDNQDARFLWEWQAAYFTRAYRDVGQAWTAPDGTVVRFDSGHHALAYSFPASTYVPHLVDGAWQQAPDSRRWVTSFPEALWWLRVNLDHEFDLGKPPSLEPRPDGLAGRPPEQWRPKGPWTPPPLPTSGWITYAMHWFDAVVVADGLEGAAAIDSAVRPHLVRTIADPGLRMVPEFARRSP
ncbi:MAG: hypothetical protein EXS13_03690 [Planctomycetes bacterium]|nr:hypothetical protein [Planctomycetota bacterium]